MSRMWGKMETQIEPAFVGPDPKMIELTKTILSQNGEIIKMNRRLLEIITTYTMMIKVVRKEGE